MSSIHGVFNASPTLSSNCGWSHAWLCSPLIRANARRSASSLTIFSIPRISRLTPSPRIPITCTYRLCPARIDSSHVPQYVLLLRCVRAAVTQRATLHPFPVDTTCLQKFRKESQLTVRRRLGLVVPLNLDPPAWRPTVRGAASSINAANPGWLLENIAFGVSPIW
jgi:hypothetical protein